VLYASLIEDQVISLYANFTASNHTQARTEISKNSFLSADGCYIDSIEIFLEHTLQLASQIISLVQMKDQLSAIIAFFELPETADQSYVSVGTWYVNELVAILPSKTNAKLEIAQYFNYPSVDLLTRAYTGTKRCGEL